MGIQTRAKDIAEQITHARYQPDKDGITVANVQDIIDSTGLNNFYEEDEFARQIHRLLSNPKERPFIQLQKWRSLGKQMIAICAEKEREAKDAMKMLDRFTRNIPDRNNKKWSDGEDELLIDMICEEEHSLLELSTIFGRTPTALKSRVSYLVGINKVSSEIAGKFIGTINGEEVCGDIKGTLNRERHKNG